MNKEKGVMEIELELIEQWLESDLVYPESIPSMPSKYKGTMGLKTMAEDLFRELKKAKQ